MFNGFHAMGAAGWLLMAAFWVALLALVAWAVVRLFSEHSKPAVEPGGSGEDARKILDRRLASGEIDIDSYEQLRSKLDPPSPAGRR